MKTLWNRFINADGVEIAAIILVGILILFGVLVAIVSIINGAICYQYTLRNLLDIPIWCLK